MKKFTVIMMLVAMCLASIPAKAQFKWGLEGGVNLSKASLSGNMFDSSNRTGWFIGPKAQFTIPVIGLGIDGAVLYSQKYLKISGNGDLAEYKESLLNEKNTAKKVETPNPKTEPKKNNNYFEIKQINAEIKKIEKLIEKLNAEKAKMEDKFTQTLDTSELIALQKDFAYLQNEIEMQENEWLNLSEKLQNLSEI